MAPQNNNQINEFLELLQSTKRGRLKVYIGSVAGVGKTYRMLQEAHSLAKSGVDVVIGYIETHGRKETHDLIEGLEIIPRMKHDYRGVTVEEMDLDAVLTRKPELVIVDELAHTNLPICRNEKRYQDVIELLLAGINVVCAFNVQHLESLNDIVEDATGIRVLETVPDDFLKKADQVVNIDLAAEDLLDRLKSGKIYKAEKIKDAMQNFFKVENLARLRELALREVAESVERPGQNSGLGYNPGSEASASDRLMVCIKPESVSQKHLLRKASRLAGKLNTDWFIVYAETPQDKPETIDSEMQRNLYSDIQLAQELGGQFIHLKVDNRLQGWVEFAERERIKHVVISSKQGDFWQRIRGKTLLQELMKQNKYDIYIMEPKSHNNNSKEFAGS